MTRSTRVALVLLVTAWAAIAPAFPAEAAKVLLLYSSRYTHLGGNNGHALEEQEADNVKAALAGLGHDVTTIAGPNDPVGDCGFGNSSTAPGTLLASAAAYQTALATTDVFFIPEHSRFCSMAFDIATQRQDIIGVWEPWVRQGGGLVISVGFEGREKIPALLSVLFGWTLNGVDGTGVTTTRTQAAATTLFAAAPATLPGNASTGMITRASLPAGSLSIYDNGTLASVVIIPHGAGKVILLGWDWAFADPPFPGQQNGGWYPAVLGAAVQEALAKRLAVSLSGDGQGVVAGSPAGLEATITCGQHCAAHFPRGTDVTLTATPAEGSVFLGWSGSGCTGTGPCTVRIVADTGVTAMFGLAGAPPVIPPSLTIELNASSFKAGQTMTVTATLTPGSSPQGVDIYLVLQLSDGRFFSLVPGGAVPGIVPVARDVVPMPVSAVVLEYEFVGVEPRGVHTWFAGMTETGTTNVVGSVDQQTFAIE